MKMFSQYKLTKELRLLLFTFGVATLLLYFAFPDYYHHTLDVQAQIPQQQSQSITDIKIISPSTGQQVPVGLLRISGTSTDNPTADCTVYADWNNTKPSQKAIATGPGGVNDYSTWTFTYTPEYHVITNGTNDLTSKLSCVDNSNSVNLTKYHSVNAIGVVAMSSTAISDKNVQHRQQLASPSSSFYIDNRTSLDNKAAVKGITITSNISEPSLPLPVVARNSNLSAAKSINLTGATTQIASEEQQPAVTAAAATTITPPPSSSSPTTTTSSASASPIVQPCCPSDRYIANAGPDQTMLEGTMVTLNGSSNNNINNKSSNVGNTANYLWRQTNGPAVVILNGNNTAHPHFVAPNHPNDTKYTFALEVSQNQVVNTNNNSNNNNQSGSAIDRVDILVKDINAISKKGGSFQQQVSTPINKSESQTQLFSAAPTNRENYDEDKYDNKSDISSAAEVATAAATSNHQYDQGKEKIEKVKEKEKEDTASVTQDKVKGSDDKEDEQEKESYDDSKHKTEEEESEQQIEKVKGKEKTEENYHDGSSSSSSGSSDSDSDIIDNDIISFSINNNNDDSHKENDLFNYDIKVKKFTTEMNQRIEKLKDRIEYFVKER
jgi:hypothetical protein